ncbi:MAG: TIGR04283 family arsenosugar biosynthesis glycosyltransferase [Nitrospirae bacterium]|nr:TIGR04283 family arsenosugar biosynthesis glycosyltransferase [Nitrospirota bacterium]
MGPGSEISIIIPVLNEASIINRTIDGILDLPFGGKVEVIVVDGSPHAETLNSIERQGIKKVVSQAGRSYQMNVGALDADGEILLFLHADTELPRDALEIISSVMRKGEFVGGAFDLGIESEKPVFRLIEMAASIRSRVTRIPYGDQAIFVRREYFRAIGGFSEVPLMEDVEFMRRIKWAGDKIYIIPKKVKTSARRWEKEGVFCCTLRNWALITLYSAGVPPARLAAFYKWDAK